jgi:hypothetical protein
MYRDTLFTGPREVDFLIGGNMSYRLENLRQSPPDYALRQNVSFHWEMDIGLQLRNRGYRLLFDPALKVDHYSAPRQIDGLRTINIEGIFWSNFNYAYLMKKHLSGYRLTVYVLYSAMIGWSDSPGFVLIMLRLFQLKPISWSRVVWPSMRGRLGGLQQPVGVGSLDA